MKLLRFNPIYNERIEADYRGLVLRQMKERRILLLPSSNVSISACTVRDCDSIVPTATADSLGEELR